MIFPTMIFPTMIFPAMIFPRKIFPQNWSFLTVAVVWMFLSGIVLGDSNIVPAGAKVEKLFAGVILTEGVAVARDGKVYFSDITFSHLGRVKNGAFHAGHIWKYDPATGRTVIFRSPSGMSNGIKFDAKGNMIVAQGADFGGRSVIRTDMNTGMSYVIAGLFEGHRFNAPNDITIDEKGRIYFSDPRYPGARADLPAGGGCLSY